MLTALFVVVFPVTVLAWLLFGAGVAMVMVLDSDTPKPPSVRAVPLPDGWAVVQERDCQAKSCTTRIVTVEAPLDGAVGPPALRLQQALVEAGWTVHADAPSIIESDEGVRLDTSALATESAPPAVGAPAPAADPNDPSATIADPAAPTTAPPTTAAPTTVAPTTAAPAAPGAPDASTTAPVSTPVDGAQTPTTLSPADALRRVTFALGFRDDATAKSYHREGLATYHVRGMQKILVLLTATTIGLGIALWVLDQFVS